MRAFQILVALNLLLSTLSSLAANFISGKVTGEGGAPLPFAGVYVNGTTKGTTTNADGYYRLEIDATASELVFRYIGYKTKVVAIAKSQEREINMDVVLEPESYSLGEIQIKADAEDPAYGIIRKAIASRKKHENPAKSYSCQAYVKGLQRLTKYPKKLFGQEIQLDAFIDTATGIVYLSESVALLEFEKPDKTKETMLSSKVSGNNRSFSFNQASEMPVNIYDNIIQIANLSPRGFISPISSGAFTYYDYRLDGSYLEDGVWINRIEVLPKRKSDPVFSGYIYIQDGAWRVHSFDLLLKKDAQIQFVDSIRINQIYIPADKEGKIWMAGTVNYIFAFGAFGFEGNGSFVSVYSQYELNKPFGKRYFKGDVLKIEQGANEKDTTYWESTRPIPLTDEELRDYEYRDSMQTIKESKPYLDSLDRKANRFAIGKIFTGYVYNDRYRKTTYAIPGLIDNIQYNTVEGLNAGVGVDISKRPDNNKDTDIGIKFRYGVVNEKWNATASYRHVFAPKMFGAWSAEGGSDLVQFNGSNPISALINTSYTLIDGRNYMKLYNKDFLKASIRVEPLNGIRLSYGMEYAWRSPVKNQSFETWARSKQFTINNPPFVGLSDSGFVKSASLIYRVGMRIRIKQKYVDRPDLKYIVGSKFPTISANYTSAIPHGGVLDADYGLIRLGIEDEVSLGMAGRLSYNVVHGRYLYARQTQFMDLFHFNGNRTVLSEFAPERFELLDYYTYSTTNPFLAIYMEHAFGGLFLNKIPGIRKLKLNEIAGARMLQMKGIDEHIEFSFGVEKLGVFRADFVMSLGDNGVAKTGFVLGIKRTFGR